MSEQLQPNEQRQPTLESWKAIARYLQRDIRTVQRWELEEGLPVRRHTHKKQATVYAYPDEIDRWRAERGQKNPARGSFRKIAVLTAVSLLVLLTALTMLIVSRDEERQLQTDGSDVIGKPPDQLESPASLDERILLGWHYFDQFEATTLSQAEEQFALALKEDPNRVQALGGAALIQVAQAFFELKPSRAAYADAREFALRALEQDPAEGVALAILGWVKFVYHWRWMEAGNLLMEAVERSPDSPWTHWFLANYLSAMNRPDEAIDSIEKALRLNPGSPFTLVAKGYILANAGRPEAALAHWTRYRDALRPDRVDGFLIFAYEDVGDFASATRLYQDTDRPAAGRLERAYRERGEAGYWEAYASILAERLPEHPDIFSWRFAVAAAKSGDTESALAMLERGFHQRSPSLVFLPIYPLEPLYGKPRFRDLVEKMGLQSAFADKLADHNRAD